MHFACYICGFILSTLINASNVPNPNRANKVEKDKMIAKTKKSIETFQYMINEIEKEQNKLENKHMELNNNLNATARQLQAAQNQYIQYKASKANIKKTKYKETIDNLTKQMQTYINEIEKAKKLIREYEAKKQKYVLYSNCAKQDLYH